MLLCLKNKYCDLFLLIIHTYVLNIPSFRMVMLVMILERMMAMRMKRKRRK